MARDFGLEQMMQKRWNEEGEQEEAAERARQEAEALPVETDKFASIMNRHLSAAEEELKTEKAKDADERERDKLTVEVEQLGAELLSLTKNYSRNKPAVEALELKLRARSQRLDELTPQDHSYWKNGYHIVMRK